MGLRLLCFLVVAHSTQALISTIGRSYGLRSHDCKFLDRRFSVAPHTARGREPHDPTKPSWLLGRSSSPGHHHHRHGSIVLHMSSLDGRNHQGDKPDRQRGGRRFFSPIRSIPKTLARFRARFAAWPTRIKRLFAIQIFMMSLLFGYMAQKVYSSSRYVAPPPVEVSYSSFLDVLERQKVDAGTLVPTMTNVRIGEDRIQYRLERIPAPINDNNDKETINNNNNNRIQLEIPSISNRNLQKILRQQKQDRLSYLSAFTRTVTAPPGLIQQLRDNGISFTAMTVSSTPSVVALTIKSLMTTFYFFFLYRFYKSMTGRGKSDSPGKLAQANALASASFDDIEGIDSAKYEVMELVDALRNPKSYALFGARAPTGLLLVGPPGTGKTMLARATAATAGVPLLYCSGSDFVEMFVGRGAARVRSIFEQARKLAPCIIFIDELDALGKSRDMGGMGSPLFSRSNDEAEQTLNQLLACMDGLDNSRRVCVLAATNRREVLDPALVRPGRFDRIVKLELPSAAGRERILRVHCSKLPNFQEGSGVDPKRPNALGKGQKVDLAAIAAVTEGLSGAELEFLVNEAAIRAVRRFDAAMSAGNTNINPVVEAADFEDSVKNYYTTRKPRGVGGIDDMLRGVLRQS